MDARRFKADLYELAGRACADDSQQVRAKVFGIADILVKLYKKNLVKINHSALELVCAHGLVKKGYGVKVEQRLGRALVCDVMGLRKDGRLIVEIETGFVPPEAALEPTVYARTRVASKIARYSGFAGEFGLGTTPSYMLDIPEFFVRAPGHRSTAEAQEIKALTDVHYNKPPISIEELMKARLHRIFLIDVERATTHEVDPGVYVETVSALAGWNGGAAGGRFKSARAGG